MAKVPAVLVIDENEDTRVELRKLLARSGLAVAGEARYGVSASSAAHELQPDAVLVGIEEPPNRALETIEALSHLLLETPILGYSTLNDSGAVRRAMRAGVRDYLTRPLDADTVREAIFSALEQEERRQLRRAGHFTPSVRGTVVTITGAKGGVGKSVVAINLALALRRLTGRSVALLDADTHFGDVATMLNLPIEHPVTRTIGQINQLDRATVVERTVQHPSGLRVLPSPSEPDEWRMVRPDDMERFITLLAEAFDFVVIDTPDVFDPIVEQCVLGATLTLLVTSLDMSSISDSKSALRILRRWDCPPEKVRLTVNFTRQRDGLRETDVEQALNWPVFWSVPYDRRVPNAAQLGDSLVLSEPKAQFSRTFTSLAGAISGVNGVNGDRSGGARRLFGWLPVAAG
jgi:pilus assembly protein CpaE